MTRISLLLLSLLTACSASAPAPADALVPIQHVTVVRSFPHDSGAFTEGLLYRDGKLFESTGMEGRSDIREVRLEDGKVLRRVALSPRLFGEGIVDWNGELISLTWQTGIGFRWDLATFAKKSEFHYPGEGWALTRSHDEIVMSDGTPVLRFLDPKTLAVRRRLTVTEDGAPVERLNEIEWIKGEIWANVWLTDSIVRIDPKTGKVLARIDLTGLGNPAIRGEDDVLNGIAYDAAGDRIFVTGKNWPQLYQVKIAAARGR
jgi:glutamine cyclotransferase